MKVVFRIEDIWWSFNFMLKVCDVCLMVYCMDFWIEVILCGDLG